MPSAAVARRAPYKDFLNPALQRRFASTALVLLGVAYIQAVFLSPWNSFIWPWFPLGPTGIRTLLIFACAIPILVLRIACCHMGTRTTSSTVQSLIREALLFQTAEVIVTHVFSSWAFSQLYLLSVPEESNMRWIIYHSGDRARLNERTLFYTVTMVVLGIDRAVMHMIWDLDHLSLDFVSRKVDGQDPVPKKDAWSRFIQEVPGLVLRAGIASLLTAFVTYAFIYGVARSYAYSWAMSFFRLFFFNLPKSNIPPGHGPWSIWMLARSIWAGFLVCLLWDLADVFLTLQLEKPPLKNNQPLTSESKDPNGSLLTGLKSPKPRISAFSIWELALISRDFDVRRKAIFDDIDRKDGPMWSQIYVICLNLLKSIELRIDNYGKPPPAPPAAQPAIADVTQNLQRIAQPLKTDDIWQPSPAGKGMSSQLSHLAKSAGSSPGITPAQIAKQKALDMIPPAQKQQLTPEEMSKTFQTLSFYVLKTPFIGAAFQQTFARRLLGAVLGTPYGEISVYINAAFVLSQLGVSSLAEDNYGNVQRDVSTLIRTFTTVITKLEKFRDGFPMHWTDMSQDRECLELDTLIDALKTGLGELIVAFGPYSTDLRLSRGDMRMAKEAAEKAVKPGAEVVKDKGKQPEMQQVS